MKIILIVGARPNFMKAYPVYEALKEDFDLTLIHTGQHFDAKMSDVFFNQLKFPKPDIHLTLEKKTKAGDFDDKLYIKNKEYLENKDKVINDLICYDGDLGQLGEIRDKLKKEFEKNKPDLVIVFGDVTSTLAAGLSAKILNIDLVHIESGLRSGDILMPEEVNRVLTDHITKYYFVTEESGIKNLKEIGITQHVYLVGNTMIDTQKKYLQQALDIKYHETLELKEKEYILITLHRPSNVDDLGKLKEIFDDLEKLAKTERLVCPIHPRTKKNLEKIGYLQRIQNNQNIILEEPLGYLEFMCLMANSKYLITDSGGLQEESTSLNIPCFTLRENTERPSTFIENHGTNQLIHKISEIELKECKCSMDLWDGRSSIKIYEKLFNIRIDLNKKVDVKFIVPEQKLIKYFYKVAPNIQNVLKEYNCYRFNCLFKLIEKDAKTILNIGTGTNYLEYLLCKENNTFLKLDTVDIIRFKNFVNVEDERINYMICDLYKISTNNKYDVVILSEIMEHLNKSDFNHVLKLIKVITNKYCIITVPFEEKYPLYDQNGTYGHKQSFDIGKVKRIFSNFKYELKMIERKAKGFNWLVIILHI